MILSCIYNCHYQFKVCVPTIHGDSQKWGISQGSMYTPPPFVLSSMTLCTAIYSLAAWKGIMPPFFNWCRYLSVGRSILHQCGRPIGLSLQHIGYLPVSLPPISFIWPCLPWPSSVSGSIPLLVHYPPVSMGIDVIPLPHIHVPSEVCSQITLPVIFTHPQWTLQ